MAVRYTEFQELNAEVMAVNVESLYSHKVWNEVELNKMVDGGIPYPMIADTTAAIGKSYDIYDRKTGKTLRGTFIIDPEGTIQVSEIMYGPVGRNPDEIIRLLRAYQQYETTKQAIPSGWQPGDKTLNPILAASGQVWQEWRP